MNSENSILVLFLGIIVGAGGLYFYNKQNPSKNDGCTCDQNDDSHIDPIRERIHEYLAATFPDTPDNEIGQTVLSLTTI